MIIKYLESKKISVVSTYHIHMHRSNYGGGGLGALTLLDEKSQNFVLTTFSLYPKNMSYSCAYDYGFIIVFILQSNNNNGNYYIFGKYFPL